MNKNSRKPRWPWLLSRRRDAAVDALSQLDTDWLGVVVSRDDVESKDISSTLDTLSSLLVDRASVQKYQGRVSISFDGFNDDPREIYEVPEIRRFCTQLDVSFPYCLYFLSMQDPSLKMFAFCLCRVEKDGPGVVRLDEMDLASFFQSHFTAMNRLFSVYSLDEETNRSISDSVVQYFAGR